MVGNIAYLVVVTISVTHTHKHVHCTNVLSEWLSLRGQQALLSFHCGQLVSPRINMNELVKVRPRERHKGHMNRFDWSGHFQENWFPLLVFFEVWSYKSNLHAKDLNFSNYIIFDKDQIYALISQITINQISIKINLHNNYPFKLALYFIPATRTA